MFFYTFAAIVGMAVNPGFMWSIAETFNGLMAIFNPIAVLLL
jgi:AGCS family alanine or glycine:cation symporter